MGGFLETWIDPNGFRNTGQETRGIQSGSGLFLILVLRHAICTFRSRTKPFRWNFRRVNCDIIRTHPFERIKRNKRWFFSQRKGIQFSEFGKIFLVKSGILGFGIRNTASGIRNTTNYWNRESKFHWLEYSTWNPESTARSLDFKTLLHSVTWAKMLDQWEII